MTMKTYPDQRSLLVRMMLALVFLLAGSGLTGRAQSSQASGTATIQGRVLNVTSGDYLNNARVTIEGTALQALMNSANFV
jgi:hypothetical protein